MLCPRISRLAQFNAQNSSIRHRSIRMFAEQHATALSSNIGYLFHLDVTVGQQPEMSVNLRWQGKVGKPSDTLNTAQDATLGAASLWLVLVGRVTQSFCGSCCTTMLTTSQLCKVSDQLRRSTVIGCHSQLQGSRIDLRTGDAGKLSVLSSRHEQTSIVAVRQTAKH